MPAISAFLGVIGVILGVIGVIDIFRWLDVLVQLVVEWYRHSQEIVEGSFTSLPYYSPPRKSQGSNQNSQTLS